MELAEYGSDVRNHSESSKLLKFYSAYSPFDGGEPKGEPVFTFSHSPGVP